MKYALVKPKKERSMQKDDQHPEPILTEDSTVSQPDLFTGTSTVITEPADPVETPFPPLVRTHPLTDQSSLAACFIPYQQDLKLRGKSDYTVTCFLSDLKMFSDYAGRDTPVGRITKEQLTDWLMKLRFGTKGQTPAPKTMARRVTFLRNFFSWLAREGVIRENPSASLVLERPLPPLPQLLFVCTDRNLNYILARSVKAAGIKKRVTLQLLRDSFAVQQLRSGVPPETLREKLGLSDEAWLESREKYRRLAFPK